MKNKLVARSQCSAVIFALIFSVMACVGTPTPDLPLPGETTTQPVESSSAWLEIYFTDPSDPRAADYEGGPDEALAPQSQAPEPRSRRPPWSALRIALALA